MSDVLFACSDEREPVPTLRQWLKTIGKRKVADIHIVVKVWKPGKYKSIVFETERFRAVLYDSSPVYKAVADKLDDLCGGDYALAIRPDRDKPGSFEIVRRDNEKPTVRAIGEFGYEFTFD